MRFTKILPSPFVKFQRKKKCRYQASTSKDLRGNSLQKLLAAGTYDKHMLLCYSRFATFSQVIFISNYIKSL